MCKLQLQTVWSASKAKIVSRTQLAPGAAMKNKKSEYSGLSREELLLRCIQDVITELVAAHKEGKDVNLNRCKTRLASKGISWITSRRFIV